MTFHVPEACRMKTPPHLYSDARDGNNGSFDIGRGLRCIASDGLGWEHVSVSRRDRTPSWDDMCLIKRLFWDAEDVVIQYHPRESEYVNNHPYCLHLWRPVGVELPTPPSEMVGIRRKEVRQKTT